MTAIQVPQAELSRPAPRPPLRLITGGAGSRQRAVFRRRRLAAALLALVVVASCVAVGRAALEELTPDPPGAQPTPAAIRSGAPAVVVAPGDTLWSIAQRLRGHGDIRATVDRLAASHGPGPLLPGERLAVGSAGAEG